MSTMHRSHRSQSIPIILILSILTTLTFAQTSSSCNPIYQTCPADPALGKGVNINFANGASSAFTTSGAPTYDQNGAAFTIAESGDSPTITSKWYIMFGHVDFVIKAAPGQGVVSSAVLLSDCLDEIDWEWLGGDDTNVQSNYFGKGQTSGYNRGAFNAAPGNHDSFNTYSIDWTAEQIAWSINGNTVRVLTAADAGSQYPQTPMQIKVGVWAGGDPANPPGTIAWAGGEISYAGGPYTMYLKAMAVTDYSTGTSYSYSGSSGTWQSIQSNGGSISSSGTGKNTPQVSDVPTVTSASGAPAPFSTNAAESSAYATRTGYPWVTASVSAASIVSSTPTYASINGLPSGWTIGADGKVHPPNAATIISPWNSSSSPLPAASSAPGFETKTTYNDQGFLTTITYADSLLITTSNPLPRPVVTGVQGVADGSPASSDSTQTRTTTMHMSATSTSGSARTGSQTTIPQAVKSGSASFNSKSDFFFLRAMLAFGAALLAL